MTVLLTLLLWAVLGFITIAAIAYLFGVAVAELVARRGVRFYRPRNRLA